MYNLIEEAKIQTKKLYKNEYLFKEEAIEMLEMLDDISNDYYKESMFDIYDDLDDYLFNEGYNMNVYDKYKTTNDECTKRIKDIKRLIKLGEYDVARKNIDICNKLISKTINEVNKEDSGVLSVILSHLFYFIIGLKKVLMATLLTLPIGGVGGAAMSLAREIKDLLTFFNMIKDKFSDKSNPITLSDLNRFKIRTLTVMKDTMSQLDKLKKQIDIIEKNDSSL